MSPLGLAIPPRCLAAPTRLSNKATRVRFSDSGYGSRESQSERLLPSRRVAMVSIIRSETDHRRSGYHGRIRKAAL